MLTKRGKINLIILILALSLGSSYFIIKYDLIYKPNITLVSEIMLSNEDWIKDASSNPQFQYSPIINVKNSGIEEGKNIEISRYIGLSR